MRPFHEDHENFTVVDQNRAYWKLGCQNGMSASLRKQYRIYRASQMAQWERIHGRRHRRCGFDPWVRGSPGKEMATHSSILVWKIPQTEEPSELIVHGGHKELDTTELTTVHLHPYVSCKYWYITNKCQKQQNHETISLIWFHRFFGLKKESLCPKMETLGFWPRYVLQMMINNPSLSNFIRVLKYVISKALNTTMQKVFWQTIQQIIFSHKEQESLANTKAGTGTIRNSIH